jgi:acetyl esterase/lipase
MADDVGAGVRAAEEVVMLWPDGPPSRIEGMPPESTFRQGAAGGPETTMLRNVSEPSLTVFLPEPGKANGIGVIVAPGGGWRILAWEHEGVDLARWLTARGYAAFLLKYRLAATPQDPAEFAKSMAAMGSRNWAETPAAKLPRALVELMRDEATAKARAAADEDGRRALALVRERAAEWGVKADRIGMIGFSAGAFLTASVAIDPGGAPLAFAAPIYGGETQGRPVPPDAPPLFSVIAADDRMLVKVVEGFCAEWSNADRPAELHIFARGAHGFGMVRQGLPVDRWVDLFGDWLADQGLA